MERREFLSSVAATPFIPTPKKKLYNKTFITEELECRIRDGKRVNTVTFGSEELFYNALTRRAAKSSTPFVTSIFGVNPETAVFREEKYGFVKFDLGELLVDLSKSQEGVHVLMREKGEGLMKIEHRELLEVDDFYSAVKLVHEKYRSEEPLQFTQAGVLRRS